MISAFGVDHGVISKGRLTWWGRPAGTARLTSAQKATRGAPGAPTGPEQIKGALNRVGSTKLSLKGVGRAAGRGVKGVGRVAEKYPGTTGTALVGGGGAAGAKALNDRYPKKQKKKS